MAEYSNITEKYGGQNAVKKYYFIFLFNLFYSF